MGCLHWILKQQSFNISVFAGFGCVACICNVCLFSCVVCICSTFVYCCMCCQIDLNFLLFSRFVCLFELQCMELFWRPYFYHFSKVSSSESTMTVGGVTVATSAFGDITCIGLFRIYTHIHIYRDIDIDKTDGEIYRY